MDTVNCPLAGTLLGNVRPGVFRRLELIFTAEIVALAFPVFVRVTVLFVVVPTSTEPKERLVGEAARLAVKFC